VKTSNVIGSTAVATVRPTPLFTRMVKDPRTKHYIERRMKDGLTKIEAIRCHKRYVAREGFAAPPHAEFALDSP